MPNPTDWITVGALAEGFAPEAFILPQLADLAGRTLTLHFANGWIIEHRFDAQALHWHAADGHSAGSAPYRATSVRPGIYRSTSSSTKPARPGRFPGAGHPQPVLHRRARSPARGLPGRAWVVCPRPGRRAIDRCAGALPSRQPGPPLAGWRLPSCTDPGAGGLAQSLPLQPHGRVRAHLPQRPLLQLAVPQGVEQGLCDTDRAHYYKIAEQLYLFVWREKIVPTLGLVMIDLQQHRSDGKIFGYQGADFDALSNFPVSSHCSVLNRTEYGL